MSKSTSMKKNYDFSNAVKNPYAKKTQKDDLHQQASRVNKKTRTREPIPTIR